MPTQPLVAHPTHPYPQFLNVLRDLPPQVKNAQDVQKCKYKPDFQRGSPLICTLDLKQIPLAAISASLTALKATEDGVDFSQVAGKAPVGKDGKKLDAAGYESVSTGDAKQQGSRFLYANLSGTRQDGGETLEEADAHPNKSENAATAEGEKATLYGWRFSKSPMGKPKTSPDVMFLIHSISCRLRRVPLGGRKQARRSQVGCQDHQLFRILRQ